MSNPVRYSCETAAIEYWIGVRELGQSHYGGTGSAAQGGSKVVSSTVKSLLITAAILLVLGVAFFTFGVIANYTSPGSHGANIGAGIAVLFGWFSMGVGLLFGSAAGITALLRCRNLRRRQTPGALPD